MYSSCSTREETMEGGTLPVRLFCGGAARDWRAVTPACFCGMPSALSCRSAAQRSSTSPLQCLPQADLHSASQPSHMVGLEQV